MSDLDPRQPILCGAADAAVMALLEQVMREHAVDRRRVLVVGYSMGGAISLGFMGRSSR